MSHVYARSVAVLAMTVALLAAGSARAAVVWDGSGVDDSLGTQENWVGDSLPAATDDVQFDGSTRTDLITGGAGRTYRSITFNNTASAFTLGGTDTISVTLTASVVPPDFANTIVNNSAATQTFNAPVALTGGSNNPGIQALAGDLVFGNLSLGTSGSTRVNAPGHTVTINGNLTSVGTGSLNHDYGTLVLNSAGNKTTWARRMGVNRDGVLRLTVSGAEGKYGGPSDTATALLVQGGDTHAGTLELVNDITIEKLIQCYARTNATAAHISSTGNNTIRGRIFTHTTASTYVTFDSNIDVISGNKLLTFAGAIEEAASTTQLVRFRGAGDTKITGTLVGTGSGKTWKVGKLGAGTLTYDSAGVNYSGDTAVFGGKLALTEVGGSALANSTKISVESGAELDVSAVNPDLMAPDFTLSATQTLRGRGTLSGNIATAASSVLAPGGTVDDLLTTYGDSAGTLSVAGGLTLGGTMNWDLAALSTSNPGTDFDTLAISGEVSLAESSQLALNFDLLDPSLRPDAATPSAFWLTPHTWKIIDAEVNSGNTSFAGIAPATTPAGWSFTTSLGTGADAGDIFLNYVPEPSTITLLILTAMSGVVWGRGQR